MTHEYEGVRLVAYGAGETLMSFIPVCEICGRFVRADRSIAVNFEDQPVVPNATCTRCGRVAMLFEGHIEGGEFRKSRLDRGGSE
jgi:hypothetical protein